MIKYVNTVPPTLTLDFERDVDGNFRGTAAFTGSKTVRLINNPEAEVFTFTVPVTASCALTFPSNFEFESSETRWNGSTNVLTLTGTGTYIVGALFDGTTWRAKATADGGHA